MLIPAHVREHFDQVVAGLQKRNIDAAPQLTTLLSLDENDVLPKRHLTKP